MYNMYNICHCLFATTATVCFFRSQPAACLLAIAASALLTRLLSVLFLSDLTFKSTIARIYCAPPAGAGVAAAAGEAAPEGPPPSLSDQDSRTSPSSTARAIDV